MKNSFANNILGLLRISIGWIFMWAFLDKLLGLGFATCRNVDTHVINFMCNKAWVNGGSPTFGYLKFAAKGPLKSIFNAMATSGLVEWMFMLGLLVVGITLIFGIAVRFGGAVSATMLFLMYLASILPENNPIIDEHIIYIFVSIYLAMSGSGRYLGLGDWWQSLGFVKKCSWLK